MSDPNIPATYNEEQQEYLRKERSQIQKETHNKITTLRVKKITRDLLSKIGSKEMSFDDIIILLLNNYSEKNNGQ